MHVLRAHRSLQLMKVAQQCSLCQCLTWQFTAQS